MAIGANTLRSNKMRSALTTLKSTVDGLVYALCTAGVFGWLWPR